MRIVSSAPTWTGEDGEFLLYISGTVRRFYWYDPTNSTWQYHEWNVSGLGSPSIITPIQLTGQTGNIGVTTIYTPAATGLYRIGVYSLCSVAGTGGTLAVTIGWTDEVGAKTLKPAADVTLTSTANGSTGIAFIRATAVAITYTTTITGGTGNPQYNLHILLERIS